MNAISGILSSRQGDFFNHDRRSDLSPPTSVIENTNYQPHSQPSIVHSPPSEVHFDQLKQAIHAMREQLDLMLRVLNGASPDLQTTARLSWLSPSYEGERSDEPIIEGVFNGQKMVGPDGQEYNVPPNYASKSKMVEGDLLKLTITNRGQFIYKQIGPVERERRHGELVSDPDTDQWSVLSGGRTYKVLKASVTFCQGRVGDEVIFLVPKDANGSAAWGAVENIIHLST